MKKIILITICFLALFFLGMCVTSAQCRGGSCGKMAYRHDGPQWSTAETKQGKGIHLDENYVYPEEDRYESGYGNQYGDEYGDNKKDFWARKGFELAIGGNIYFGSKKTANYYNGAPESSIGLVRLLFDNEYRWLEVMNVLRTKYHYIDAENVKFREDYNYKSHYNIAMDVAVALKYRFHQNYYFELSYSFRRLTVSNRFIFEFEGGIPGNKENPPWSGWENIVAKEDRHYIDLSVGYILQIHPIAKPFIALGAQFTYIRIKDFKAVIEGHNFDLLNIAKYPNSPYEPETPKYTDWAGVGYGFFLNAGLKIAVHPAVSLDPIFQLSIASFGNNKTNLPGFHTNLCLNYIAGVRLVLNDALFMRKDR